MDRTTSSPLFVRTYDLLLWLLPQTAKFPRARRHTLTNRLEGALLDFQGTAIRANRQRGPARLAALQEAQAHLDQTRFLVRLATDLGHLSTRQYAFLAERLAEIGRLLGGWQRVTARTLERVAVRRP
jgi:hypothetical protein